MAAAVPAIPWQAPSSGDGQRRGEDVSHPSGGGPAGEPFHPEPGPGGAAVSVSRVAGVAGWGGGAGGWRAVRGRAAVDGGVAIAGPCVDFQRRQITVRQGKGGKDRRTMLPAMVGKKLRVHLEGVRRLHRQDLAEGVWQGRHHLDPSLIQKAVRRAVLASGIVTPAITSGTRLLPTCWSEGHWGWPARPTLTAKTVPRHSIRGSVH